MSPDLRERLPAELLPAWDRVASLEDAILGTLAGVESGETGALAEERSALLRSLCDTLRALPDTVLREDALTALLERNAALTLRGSEALADATARSAAGALQRRAIAAYGAVEN